MMPIPDTCRSSIRPVLSPKVSRFHATVLSNFARGFDKYSLTYSKVSILESTYPGQFFLLNDQDIHQGLAKAERLLPRTGHAGERILLLETQVNVLDLQPNTRTNIGHYVQRPFVRIFRLFLMERTPVNSQESDAAGHSPRTEWTRRQISVEDAYAASMALHSMQDGGLKAYADLRPRTVSVLPIAQACQARCRFCFSEASVSQDQEFKRNPLMHEHWFNMEERVRAAQQQGATRFVITGGGEPGLLPHADLLRLMRLGASTMTTTVLITNGVHLARLNEEQRAQRLNDYQQSGLSVLSISRHHSDDAHNSAIMGLDTQTQKVLATWARLHAKSGSADETTFVQPQKVTTENCGEFATSSEIAAMNSREAGPESTENRQTSPSRRTLEIRLIVVLQRGGVEDAQTVGSYLDWAVEHGVRSLCFKELYVSSTLESAYHAQPANVWAREHQVSLAMLTDFLDQQSFKVVSRLPWGSPIYQGVWKEHTVSIAAYTEPTLFWERQKGVARSWNIMADGQCLVSLEDPGSALSSLHATGVVADSCALLAPTRDQGGRSRRDSKKPKEEKGNP